MASESVEFVICNGVDVVDSKEGSDAKDVEEDFIETDSLLQEPVSNVMEEKRQKRSRRKVQWNDHNGDKLFEVLEFQPSDSSDSEDEYAAQAVRPGYRLTRSIATSHFAVLSGRRSRYWNNS